MTAHAAQELRSIFSEILDLEPGVEVDRLIYGSDGWDSLAHMSMVGEIEERFDVMLDTDDVIGMSSFEIALKTLARYGVDLAP